MKREKIRINFSNFSSQNSDTIYNSWKNKKGKEYFINTEHIFISENFNEKQKTIYIIRVTAILKKAIDIIVIGIACKHGGRYFFKWKIKE